jgi:hypothetical protein
LISKEKYVPILKGKKGEFIALKSLNAETLDNFVPVIDIVPIAPKKNLEKHLLDTVNYFKKFWDRNRLIYMDGYMIQDEGNLSNGQYLMDYIFDELSKDSFNVIPVISNVSGVDYSESIKRINERDGKGVCIRIFIKSMKEFNNEIERIVSYLGIGISSTDLLIDLGSLEDLTVENAYLWVKNILKNLTYQSEFRSLILAGGNFPIDLTQIKPDQIFTLERKEWKLWQKIVLDNEIERIPSYSDYAISHPSISVLELEYPNASASIRYTHENDFYIYRGRGTRQHSFDQFYDISEALIGSIEFYKKEHCAGDAFIYQCGTEKKKPGSLTTWRWVGTCHHLTVVINQLRQFFLDFNNSRTS